MRHHVLVSRGGRIPSPWLSTTLSSSATLFQCSSNVQFKSSSSTATAAKPKDTDSSPTTNVDGSKLPLGRRAKEKEADREFFTHLLSSATTNRDAKAYLSRLKNPKKTKPLPANTRAPQPRVNLGNLFARGRAVEESPIFSQYATPEKKFEETERIHLALVKISDIEGISDKTLAGISETLAQLNRLSMSPCVLLDSIQHGKEGQRQNLIQQADRLVTALARANENGARRVDSIFGTSTSGGVRLSPRDLLLRPLRRNQIPVITPIAYSGDTNRLEVISTHQAAVTLTREFSGLNIQAESETSPENVRTIFEAPQQQQQISLDRIITIDQSGGIPNENSIDGKRVFVNLEQEFDILRAQLATTTGSSSSQSTANLQLLRDALQYLPPASSGLMTTYGEASNLDKVAEDDNFSSVGTRRQKNALIHNLLTDKPVYSPSLPSGRLNRDTTNETATSVSTFVKRGMPVTILPDASREPWNSLTPRLKLTDPRIDLGRLVHLIEDSFNRKLDVEHYLQRVNDRIAGVIIAGEYEGGALLTWETPPGADPEDATRLVPYLDKFAVLKRSQGAGGVADIVFNAMVRTCFPRGVCWRSRKNNPVNKWYFERSRGTWKIPEMNWTMFWTTPEVEEAGQLFHDYEGVCRGVEPSWADKKKAAD